MRDSVKQFAETIEATLQKNDYKGGWDHCSLVYLYERLEQKKQNY